MIARRYERGMIPNFPKFGILKPEMGDTIRSFCAEFSPYSDFNFTSLWAWGTSEETQVSMLNGNLVVDLQDYVTGAPTCTFIGRNQENETARLLLDRATQIGNAPLLKWIPECVAGNLCSESFSIEVDAEQHDYLFGIRSIAEMESSSLRSKRKNADKFEKMHPNSRFVMEPLRNLSNRFALVSLARGLASQSNDDADVQAVAKLLDADPSFLGEVFVSILEVDDEIIAFGIDEITAPEIAMSHFFRGDRSRRGAHDYFNKRLADALLSQGLKVWNWQQDLGLKGLAKSKLSYRPIKFLRKYTVRFK